MKLSIFGSGYVGLVTGACLADVGHTVTCVDIDADRISRLRQGQIPIYEPGLDDLVQRNQAAGRLHFTTDAAEAVRSGTLQFIAVGTPPAADGSADLSHVKAVARDIARHMDDYRVIVNKSTVPVGTADMVRQVISDGLQERGASIPFDVCSNPEFLREGSAIGDFTRPDRVIVGTETDHVHQLMRECYHFLAEPSRLIFMDVRSAELTKYAANAMLATRISFMNEMANLADRLGADVEKVRLGIGTDPRIGSHFLAAGCGYGGSCFPKDVRALGQMAQQCGYDAPLISAVETVNNRQKQFLHQKLKSLFHDDLRGRTIALWGLAFKPETDDMREAPSRVLMEALWEEGARVQAYDPEAQDETRRLYGERPDLILAENQNAALEGADALVICTEWSAFRNADLKQIAALMKTPLLLDGRNLFAPEDARAAGLAYHCIGRPTLPTS